MQSKYVALFRGINVGKAKRVSMADLRTLVEGLGYSDVRTLLNSGNVVFTAARPVSNGAARIEKALAAELGLTARVTVLSAAEVDAAVTDNPLLKIANDPSRLLVAVPNTPADRRKLEPLLKHDWANEALALGPRVAYVWCADGILASKLAAAVGKAVGDAVTSRNWTTMLKLHAMMAE